MKPTLKMIAEKTGFSIPTVSMVIHGKGRITDETRQKVLDCAKEMGYPIHLRQKSLQKGEQPHTIALLFQIDKEWTFTWRLIQPIIYEIEKDMRESGYTVLLIPITSEMSSDLIMAKIVESRVRGVFAIHFGDAALFTLLEESKIPVVLVMNNDYQDRFYSICSDDFQGSYEGTRYLIGKGHTTIAYIETEREGLPRLLHDRHFGFRKALSEESLLYSRSNTLHYSSAEELAVGLETLLYQQVRPTALFCLDDEVAMQVLFQLKKMGFEVPSNLSILSPGDVLEYSLPYTPQITTMRINTPQMGRLAAEMMIGRLTKVKNNDVMVVKVRQELVDRHSVSTIAP